MRPKLPLLPPDWTVGRGLMYAARLGLFVLVPGLHQIASKRWLFGGLLLVMYFAAEFTKTHLPFDYTEEFDRWTNLSWNMSEVIRYMAWLLLALDIRKLETRKVTRKHFLVLACAAGIFFIPAHPGHPAEIYVEQANYVCPEFCKYDIIQYKRLDHPFGDPTSDLEGKYVVIGDVGDPRYTTKLLSGSLEKEEIDSVKKGCRKYREETESQRFWRESCEYELTDFLNKYLIAGGPNPVFKNRKGEHFSFIWKIGINGINPERIGNIREYFVFNEEVTDFVGNALLTVYKWTGINLFGWSEKTSAEQKTNIN